MKVAESGMYIIVLNLRDDQIKVSVKPAEVYGIGDALVDGMQLFLLISSLLTTMLKH